MADRLSQYGMVPNFAPNMMQHHQLNQALQQQQQQQQTGQQQQDGQQHHPMGGFPDQNRVWSVQQQMHQMRTQNGPDMGVPPVQQQMADLLRSQSMARAQGQQQHQFGLGAGQMGGGSAPGQQQSFLDQSNQPQHNMSMGFPNLGQNPSFQQSMQNRQTMLQALQGNQGHNRQLELMGLAQNQQNQNGPINLANKVMSQSSGMGIGSGPPGLNPQSAPNDIFSSSPMNSNDAMRRPSPSHPPQPQPLGNQPQPGPAMSLRPQTFNLQGRTINISDLMERATSLRNMIQTSEMQVRQLQSQRPGMPDTVFMNKMRSFQADIASRKENLAKITTLMNLYMQNNGSLNGINPSNMPPQQQGQPNSGAQGWMGQNNSLQPQFGNNSTQPGHSQPQPPGPGQQSSPSLLNSQANHHMNSMSPNPTPRSGPTPQINAPFPNSMPPGNVSSHLNFPMNNSQHNGPNMGTNAAGVPLNIPTPFPALEKSRFETSYKQWCVTKSIQHDPRLLVINGRPIDLYQLHTHVMREGGLSNVQNKDLWSVIGARMGWGQPSDPLKSGSDVATHLAHVYKEYLAAFDAVYIASVIDSRRKQMQSMGQHPGNFPGNPNQMPAGMKPGMMPNQMRLLVACADKSVAELRQRGMSEQMISFIESHRASLQQMAGDQSNFRVTLRPNPGAAGPSQLPGGDSEQQGGAIPGANQPPFAGSPPQHPAGPSSVPPGNVASAQFPPTQNGAFPPKSANPIDHHPPPQNSSGPLRLNREQVAMANQAISRFKAEFVARSLPSMPSVEVPPEQRANYNAVLDQLNRLAQDLEPKLAVYHALTKSEEYTRRLLTILITSQHQRVLLASASPKFIVPLHTLQMFLKQMFAVWQQMEQMVQATKGEHPGQPPQNMPPGPPNNGPPGAMPLRPPPHSNAIPPQPSPQPPQPSTQTQPVTSSLRPPMALNPPPAKRKVTNPAAVSTPTPPASASTPVASAPTPTHAASSPQTPKSPKGKAAAKAKAPQKRKASTKVNAPNATPTTEPAQIPAQATNGVKRPREEDTASSPPNAATPSTAAGQSTNDVANEPSPPKRIKTEWEGPVSETLKHKKEAVEAIKTEEEASQFFEQMTELIKMTAEDDSQTLSLDISDTLDQLLKGCSSLPDLDGSSSLSALGLGEASTSGSSGEPSTSSSQLPMNNDFAEFFDFSSFTGIEDEDESKADTPDLIPSSSTNPSPESQSGEADPAHHASALLDVKQEQEYDLLRLGTLKEVDGGESAYYQPPDWKWDGPMPTLEQPWPILHS